MCGISSVRLPTPAHSLMPDRCSYIVEVSSIVAHFPHPPSVVRWPLRNPMGLVMVACFRQPILSGPMDPMGFIGLPLSKRSLEYMNFDIVSLRMEPKVWTYGGPCPGLIVHPRGRSSSLSSLLFTDQGPYTSRSITNMLLIPVIHVSCCNF